MNTKFFQINYQKDKFYFTVVDIVVTELLALIGQHPSIPRIVQQVVCRRQQPAFPQHTGACI
jgi:hypothetical protein